MAYILQAASFFPIHSKRKSSHCVEYMKQSQAKKGNAFPMAAIELRFFWITSVCKYDQWFALHTSLATIE